MINEEKGRIFLTKDAEFILIGSDEQKKAEIVKKCALQPEVYRKLWEQYSDTGLPSDESLRDVLIFDYGFNEKSVDGFIKDFKATINYAGLEPSESNLEEVEESSIL